jgi:hypothetical protein
VVIAAASRQPPCAPNQEIGSNLLEVLEAFWSLGIDMCYCVLLEF